MPDPSFRPPPIWTRPSERGATLVLFTLMIACVVLPMMGLAIDGSVAYLAHQRLISAVDAAALAGARSLNVGENIDAQTANATEVAKRYFAANFPTGLLNSSNATARVTITPPSSATQYKTFVQVDASADVGLYLLAALGHTTSTISASAITSRREVNVILALDRSGSMSRVCEVMKNDAKSFVNMFIDGRDALGLVTFMGNAKVDSGWTTSFKSQPPNMTETLGTLNCGGNTGSAAALSLAHDQIKEARGARPWASNVIVFFTDGVPNGYLAGFPLQSGKSCLGKTIVAGYLADGGGIYDPTPQPISSTAAPEIVACPHGLFGTLASNYSFIPGSDLFGNSARASGYAAVTLDANNQIQFSAANSNAISKNAADDAALKIRQDGIIIYAIGLDGNGGVDGKLLQRIANDPLGVRYLPSQPAGKYFYTPNVSQLGAAFNAIASEILRLAQ